MPAHPDTPQPQSASVGRVLTTDVTDDVNPFDVGVLAAGLQHSSHNTTTTPLPQACAHARHTPLAAHAHDTHAQRTTMPAPTTQIKSAIWAFAALACMGWILAFIGLAGAGC
jgi:hypothetical protein